MVSTKKIGLRILAIFLAFSLALTMSFAAFQMEWGSTTSSNETWVTITLDQIYDNPIVVASPEYSTTTQPNGISTWIRNVTSTSFELRTSDENLNSLDDITVHYIAMEEGNWTLPDNGIKVQAGQLLTDRVGTVGAGNWGCPANGVTVNFNITFNSNPLVISTRGSDNNPSVWATTFQNNPANEVQPVTTSSMCIGLSQSKAISPGLISNSETIYWIAVDEGNGTLGGVEFEILWNLQDTGDSGGNWINGFGDSPPYTQSWAHTWVGDPDIIVGSITSTQGTDGGWGVIYDTGDVNDIRIFVDEANERAHTGSESGGGWAFDTAGSIGILPPQVVNASFNETIIPINNTAGILATVLDVQGNNTITSVIATIVDNASTQYNVSLVQDSVNSSLNTADLESGVQGYLAQTGGETIGEAGSVDLVDRDSTLITFTQTYASTPVIIAIASTENTADENPFIPIVHSINTTHANISLCQDDGLSTNCATGYLTETVDYFVFDIDKAKNYSWIDVGFVNSTTDGTATAFTFNTTFTTAPYVWGLPQTYNIGAPGIAAHQWFTSITTTGANIIACDHPYGAGSNEDDCAGTATEMYGYVAIDLTNNNISDSEGGTVDISDSLWTSILFGNTYTTPRILVGVNNENGGQDGKYPWARDVTSTGADIRYCEHDGNSDCDTHNPENTRWFVIEEGPIKIGNGGDDVERAVEFVQYQNVFTQEAHNISLLNFTVTVSTFIDDGSNSNGNNDPDLELQFFSTTGWMSLGELNITGTGDYTLTSTNISLIQSWSTKSNRDVRIRPIDIDFGDASNIDQINWSGLVVGAEYTNFNGTWRGVFTNTSKCGDYNLSTITATDEDFAVNQTSFNRTLTVSCSPVVTLLTPTLGEKVFGNGTVNLTWFIQGSPGANNCDLIFGSTVYTNLTCNSNQNTSIVLNLPSGFYNWSVNATDSINNTGSASYQAFYNIIDRDMAVSKKILWENTNQYLVEINYTKFFTYDFNTTLIDYAENPYSFGSFNLLYNFTDIVTGNPFSGDILGWNLSDSTLINYSVSNPSGSGNLSDLYIVGLE